MGGGAHIKLEFPLPIHVQGPKVGHRMKLQDVGYFGIYPMGAMDARWDACGLLLGKLGKRRWSWKKRDAKRRLLVGQKERNNKR